MGIEIERRFFLKNDSWRNHIVKEKHIIQGYLDRFITNSGIQRIRIEKCEGKEIAKYTIKATMPGTIMSRKEWEFDIPVDQAYELLDAFSDMVPIKKIRYIVDYKGHTWEIDKFTHKPDLIIAELELSSEDEEFIHPNWLGAEITDKSEYSNYQMYRIQNSKSYIKDNK